MRLAEREAAERQRERAAIMAALTPLTAAEKIGAYRTEKAMSDERNAPARAALWARIEAAIARADAAEEQAAKGGRPRRKRGPPISVGWRMR